MFDSELEKLLASYMADKDDGDDEDESGYVCALHNTLPPCFPAINTPSARCAYKLYRYAYTYHFELTMKNKLTSVTKLTL